MREKHIHMAASSGSGIHMISAEQSVSFEFSPAVLLELEEDLRAAQEPTSVSRGKYVH